MQLDRDKTIVSRFAASQCIQLKAIFLLALLSALIVAAAEPNTTNGPTVLPPITVIGQPESSATSPPIESAEEQKQQVPGGFTLRSAQIMDEGRGSSFEDLLQGVPGVDLQSQNGMELTRVSIRGSGILNDDEPIGVQFLLDGFPFNQGDGEVILEDFNLGSIKYAEVFRGANAFKYGSFSLGGAINLVSKTGYDADPLQLRLEGGSFGFFRGQLSSGAVQGPLDYYISLEGRTRDGYREHSYENTENLYGNLGWKISDHVENRFYLSLTRTDRLLPNGLTKEQLETDPQQADPLAIEQDLNKEWSYIRLADKATYKTDREEANAGVYWWHRDLLTRGLYTESSPEGIQTYYSDNVGFLLDSVTRTELFGQQNLFTVGFAPNFEREVDFNYQNLSGQKGEQTAHDSELSINLPLYAEDQQFITEHFSILAGIQASYVQRKFTDMFNDTPVGDQSDNLVFHGLNPKIGAIYQFDKESQVFANFSRSFQPPSFDNMVDFGDDPGDSLVFTPLNPQHAWTAELGTRGQKGRFEWELAFYHSWVRNELLDINNAQGVDRGAVNVDRTYHQGIEAGLQIDLIDSILTQPSTNRPPDWLSLDQTYTLNDFHFDNDPVYGNNRIAGVPIHLYTAALVYRHPSGFYAAPIVQWNITDYPADHANTISVDSYALIGFKMGFVFKKKFQVFFEAKNLTDQRYAAAVTPIPDARTADGPIQIYYPGDGRAFYGGFSWRW